MKNKQFNLLPILALVAIIADSCSSTKDLTYLNNLPASDEPQYFTYVLEDYRIQYRDILYIDVKMLNAEGKIENILQGNSNLNPALFILNSGPRSCADEPFSLIK